MDHQLRSTLLVQVPVSLKFQILRFNNFRVEIKLDEEINEDDNEAINSDLCFQC